MQASVFSQPLASHYGQCPMPSDRTIWAGSERTPYLDGLRETCGGAFQPTGIRRMLCTASWYGSWRDRTAESHPRPRHLERKRNVGRALGGRAASRSRLSRPSRRPENINSIISLIMEACVYPGRCLLRPCIATTARCAAGLVVAHRHRWMADTEDPAAATHFQCHSSGGSVPVGGDGRTSHSFLLSFSWGCRSSAPCHPLLKSERFLALKHRRRQMSVRLMASASRRAPVESCAPNWHSTGLRR